MKLLFLTATLFAVTLGASMTFQTQSGTIPTPHAAGGLAIVNGVMVKAFGFLECFDGSLCDFVFDPAVYERVLDDPTGEWIKYTPEGNNQPLARAYPFFETDETDGTVVVYGGVVYNARFTVNQVFGDMWKYSPDTHHWRRVVQRNVGPGARIGAWGAIRNGVMYTFGGMTFENYNYVSHNDVWQFDFKTNLWTLLDADDLSLQTVSTYKPSVRYISKVELMGNQLLVFQGNWNPTILGEQVDDFWSFDLVNKSWTGIPIPANLRSHVHGASIVYGDNLIHVGGDVNDDVNECKVNEISGGQNPVDEVHVWNRLTGWRTYVQVANAYKGKRVAYANHGPFLYLHGGFDFKCAEEFCENGKRCFNPRTSYPIWNQYLYRFDVREIL